MLRNVQPTMLMVVALPVLAILAPGGIPFTSAACDSDIVSCTVGGGIFKWPCKASGVSIVAIGATTTDTTFQKCKMSATISSVDIADDGCDLNWKASHDSDLDPACDSGVAIQGPATGAMDTRTVVGECSVPDSIYLGWLVQDPGDCSSCTTQQIDDPTQVTFAFGYCAD